MAPVKMITGDWTYFEAVKSPLLDNVQLHAQNLNLGDWFEVEHPEHSRPATVRVLGTEEFLLSFATRLNDASIPLLDDLNAKEKSNCSCRPATGWSCSMSTISPRSAKPIRRWL